MAFLDDLLDHGLAVCPEEAGDVGDVAGVAEGGQGRVEEVGEEVALVRGVVLDSYRQLDGGHEADGGLAKQVRNVLWNMKKSIITNISHISMNL